MHNGGSTYLDNIRAILNKAGQRGGIMGIDLMGMRKGLNSEQLSMVSMELERKKKQPVVMWLLWLFTGAIGGHRYYLGDIGKGIAMTLTLGGLGIWALIDAFFISRRLEAKNAEIEANIIQQVKAM